MSMAGVFYAKALDRVRPDRARADACSAGRRPPEPASRARAVPRSCGYSDCRRAFMIGGRSFCRQASWARRMAMTTRIRSIFRAWASSSRIVPRPFGLQLRHCMQSAVDPPPFPFQSAFQLPSRSSSRSGQLP